ncbi:MAG: right-handed parallel beta-helix repeat-containing protein [Planctomycetes bacterium]|nr:right-handed parallel beta-helix repeat-containing protein [Planctomycetota bacterium]MCC7169304.1 right-handed parallel beta-helix repeat-containing protein [Planctomycetota bacterium]
MFRSSLAAFVLLTSVASASTLRVPKDFPTIQDAVDAAVSGDTIRVAKGTYFENVVVPVGKNDLTIRGSGPATIVDARPFGPVGSGPALEVTADGFRLENLTARFALGFTPSVIRIAGDDAVVRRVRVYGGDDQGIVVLGERARIERCAVRGGDVGIFVAGNDASVRDCVVSTVHGMGVGVSGSHVLIRGCRVANAGETAIAAVGLDIAVEKNRVAGTGDDALLVSTDHVRAIGNVVRHSAGSHGGIVVDGATSGVVAKNVLSDCDGPGLAMLPTTSSVALVGNRAVRCGRADLAAIVLDGADCSVVNNRAVDSPGDAFMITGLGNELTKNVALRSALDGFDVGASTMLSKNVARDNHAEGFAVVVLGVSMSGNHAQRNRIDIASSFALDAFVGNQFGTGGEGVSPVIDD